MEQGCGSGKTIVRYFSFDRIHHHHLLDLNDSRLPPIHTVSAGEGRGLEGWLPAPGGQRPGVLPTLLQCAGQPPTTKSCLVSNVGTASSHRCDMVRWLNFLLAGKERGFFGYDFSAPQKVYFGIASYPLRFTRNVIRNPILNSRKGGFAFVKYRTTYSLSEITWIVSIGKG